MLASLRVADRLWDAQTVAVGDDSQAGSPGPATAVALYLKLNSGTSVTVKITVANSGALPSAGRNAVPADDADWYDLQKKDASGDVVLVQLTAADPRIAIDLSPFAPPFVRLTVTEATGSPNVTAFMQAVSD